jgi:hypothetical protein
MAETPRPVTPLTALVVNADGQRYVIVGNSEVLEAWNQDKDQDKKQDNGS